jgi:inorganic triphosphatase YgiF
MPHEIEIKLETPAPAATRLSKASWLRKLATAPAKRRKLVSVYYDTRKCRLHEAGLSLRVRRDGDKTVQTIKAGDAGFSRKEWETEIARRRPDLARAKGTALDQFNLKKLRRKLRPMFETSVQRMTIPVRYCGSKLEIAVDRGQVKTGRKREPISEIEIELKKGEPGPAVKLARRIANETNAAYGPLPKAARGYSLSAGTQRQPVFAEEIRLDPDLSTADCLKAIGLSCLHHLAANADAVVDGAAEGVHQMRVGLRRLRAAISVFKQLLAGPETEAIKQELKWLTEQLGPARDMDVLVEESVVPLQRAIPEKHEIAALKIDLKGRRRSGFERAAAAAQSDRYRKLILDTALWLGGGSWSTSADELIAARRGRRGVNFASEEISRRAGKICKKLNKLENLNERQRHKLRIAIKKLRYASEFFAGLYNRGKARRRRRQYDSVLKGLQSALGKLNDIRVHDELARSFSQPRRGARKRTQRPTRSVYSPVRSAPRSRN